MMKYVHSNYTLAAAMLGSAFSVVIVNLLISVAENALLVALVIAMSLPFYHWMLTTSVEGAGGRSRRKAAKVTLEVKNKGVVKELIFTDLKRVMRESQMGFQCIMSLIMLPLMVVVFYFCFNISGEGDQSIVERTSTISGNCAYHIFVVYVFIGND